MQKRIRPWIVFLIGAFLSFKAAWWYAILVGRLEGGRYAMDVILVEALAWVIIPALGGLLALRLDDQPKAARIPRSFYRRLRVGLACVLALGYFMTWSFGVPSVISRLTCEEVGVYRELEARNHDRFAQADPPSFATRVAVPLVPGVILVYWETYLHNQAGWGGWVVYGWWGSGSRELRKILRRIS